MNGVDGSTLLPGGALGPSERVIWEGPAKSGKGTLRLVGYPARGGQRELYRVEHKRFDPDDGDVSWVEVADHDLKGVVQVLAGAIASLKRGLKG